MDLDEIQQSADISRPLLLSSLKERRESYSCRSTLKAKLRSNVDMTKTTKNDEESQQHCRSLPSHYSSPYIMTEALSREKQPASLETFATCVTRQQQQQRPLSAMERQEEHQSLFVKRLSNKKNATQAKLMAILLPLVLYSLFHVTANLLLTQNQESSNQQLNCITSRVETRKQDNLPHQHPLIMSTRKTTTATHCERLSPTSFIIVDAGLSRIFKRNNDEEKQNVVKCSASQESQAERISKEEEESTASLLSTIAKRGSQLYGLLVRAFLKPSPLFGGPKVLMAEAASASTISSSLSGGGPLDRTNSNKGDIIVLNSTNFNTELIQHEHPFPHVKLIEYYLSYCGICLKFKPTYIELAREIYPWRNVIRVSAIDLGVSSNSPIAHSWSVDVVPTLRIHPPPKEEIAEILAKQLSSLLANSNKSSQRELQKSAYDEYKRAKLMVDSLEVIKYTSGKRSDSSIADKVGLLKLDLIDYIERFVKSNPDSLPDTWPNLLPVKETSLNELRRKHPRQEIFLIIEADSSSNDKTSNLSGLQIMLELSSSAAWKAIRYVRASENRKLIEDVIAQKRLEENDKSQEEGQAAIATSSNEQIELLNSLMSDGRLVESNILLVHIDFSHSSMTKAPLSKFPYITIVTSSDLMQNEQSIQYDQQQNGIGSRARRAINQIESNREKSIVKRSLFSSTSEEQLDSVMSLRRKLELVALYIKQTYTETKDDRQFLTAMSKLDNDPASAEAWRELSGVAKDIRKSSKNYIANTDTNDDKNATTTSTIINENSVGNSNGKIIDLIDSLKSMTTFNKVTASNSSNKIRDNLINDQDSNDDYDDKLRAIRYIFFQEVPRKSLMDKSPSEKLEKLNILLNLVSAIKAYFPLPDAASVQFMDGVQAYLVKQQQLLIQPSTGASFDTKALKQELRRLESEGKRLPDVERWKHCEFGGYPCALWRLFHTLTAFEYMKLSQINQRSPKPTRTNPSHENQQVHALRVASEVASSALSSEENQRRADLQHPTADSLLSHTSYSELESHQLNSPVERLVSPPSTTTSLSLTIATPISSQLHPGDNNNSISNKRQHELDLLPPPVLLVMRDYITQFFSCEDCARKFKLETNELNFERIRQQEPVEFSILWLWETHNRVSKRLSINPESNPPEHPKKWFPSYNQCPKCYLREPSYLRETNLELAAIFHESIEWNREEVLSYLLCQYTRQPMDNLTNIFGYQVPYGIVVVITCSLLLIILLRCASCYIERQRKYKASLLNGNGYSMVERDCN